MIRFLIGISREFKTDRNDSTFQTFCRLRAICNFKSRDWKDENKYWACKQYFKNFTPGQQ